MDNPPARNPASFRDPHGFVFHSGGDIYRAVMSSFRLHYDFFLQSGLYRELSEAGLVISHEEVQTPVVAGAYRILRPTRLPFISYPYEWCFSQLKAAALLTLRVARIALERGMILKDATSFNVQFVGSQPVFIDSLSFEIAKDAEPWIAYRQFCEHFLAPLALMSMRDVRLGSLLQTNIDGIPLDLASNLLPLRSHLSLGLQMHVHLHARSQRRFRDIGRMAQLTEARSVRNFSRFQLFALFDSLDTAVEKLDLPQTRTEWSDYYNDTNYSQLSFEYKKTLVASYLREIAPTSIWDLGANTGEFSELAASIGTYVVAFDADAGCVEGNFRRLAQSSRREILPLVLDLTNPTPGIGWAHAERQNLETRGAADALLALALVHHLTIGKNIPLANVFGYLARLSPSLIIEFMPKSDSQVKRMLASRQDVFDNYTQAGFEQSLSSFYAIRRRDPIPGSERILYLLKRNDSN